MPLITLYHNTSGEILFEGDYPSTKVCLEKALELGSDLTGLELNHQDLSNINLDGAKLNGCQLRHCNLSGANLSECSARAADFSGSSFYNSCLCESDFTGSTFDSAHFGATDITDSILDDTRFTTYSAFLLNFALARSMKRCTYICPADNKKEEFSTPPLVIYGITAQPKIILNPLKTESWRISAYSPLNSTCKRDLQTL
jgi:hypothetical protein